MKAKPDQGGSTLIELMIVVAVVAVLAAIAIPMYRDFVVRSNRSDAIISLTELANLQEKHYSNEMTYTTALAALSYSAASPEGFYNLEITAGAGPGISMAPPVRALFTSQASATAADFLRPKFHRNIPFVGIWHVGTCNVYTLNCGKKSHFLITLKTKIVRLSGNKYR